MRLRLFNHHKLKRKIKRHLGHGVLGRTGRGRSHAHRLQDVSWQSAARNPYYAWSHDQKSHHYGGIFLILLSLIVTAGVIIWHPFFRIQEINVSGEERVKSADVATAVRSSLASTIKGIFPASNFFLVPLRDIEQALLKQFPLQTVHIKKIFPQMLTVELKEKTSTIIYDNGRTYSYLGLDGKLVENLRSVAEDEWQVLPAAVGSTTTERVHTPPVAKLATELGDYPIVYDERTGSGNPDQPGLSAESAHGVVAWWQNFHRQNNRRLGYFAIADNGGSATIHFVDKHEVRVRLDADLANQFARLQLALQQKESRSAMSIDVRYPGRVYWQ